MSIQPHEQRVIDEKTQLKDKLDKLLEFLQKGQPSFIDDKNWRLLNWQFNAMQIYNDILKERIEIFGVNQ